MIRASIWWAPSDFGIKITIEITTDVAGLIIINRQGHTDMTNKNSLVLLLLATLLSFSASVNAAVTGWGAFADIQIKNCGSVCNPFPWDEVGGLQTSASASDTNGTSNGFAEATLSGSGVIATPTLRGYAQSQSGIGVLTHAVGAQGYTYGGIAQTITLDVNLDAILTDPSSNTDASAEARIAVVFANNLPFTPFETDFGEFYFETVPAVAPLAKKDSISVFSSINSGVGSLSFDVMPGDEFLIWASLDVEAVGAGAIADARNTLTMEFFDATGKVIDDSSILIAEAMADVGVVPLPAAVWLFGTALLGLVGFAKRRKAA